MENKTCQDNRCLDRDSNRKRPGYMSVVSELEAACSGGQVTRHGTAHWQPAVTLVVELVWHGCEDWLLRCDAVKSV
jgi:hypothetical protein